MRLSSEMIPGIWFTYLPIEELWGVNGSSNSKGVQMAPLLATRVAWWLKDIFKRLGLTFRKHSVRLLSQQPLELSWHWLFSMVGNSDRWTSTTPSSMNHGDKPLVCRLKKALYGLKQALGAWFSKLRDFLLSSQFFLAKLDSSLFIKKTDSVVLYVLVYIDDIIITSNHQANIDQFVTNLDTQFSLKDLGPLSYFFGIEVCPTSTGLFLSQRKYVLDLLRKAKMDQANSSLTPMVTSSILSQHTGCAIENALEYRSIVGAL
ncbi:Retrovirus-related Pol polyprotein from transposon TNT 1-94 [Gossypium australe]|uniref:Retrovirus-related Pol polyprotein from transposon TNT 1-94 n=1 Tax=Gossypium australe TaxID=47621 RepID=A0A5B6WHX3_9ROSI|nr:Retrovirus-related Pol polyprotein from transposon TNT 1-94 [Gossypium australe]